MSQWKRYLHVPQLFIHSWWLKKSGSSTSFGIPVTILIKQIKLKKEQKQYTFLFGYIASVDKSLELKILGWDKIFYKLCVGRATVGPLKTHLWKKKMTCACDIFLMMEDKYYGN